jgi:hypothetical protein
MPVVMPVSVSVSAPGRCIESFGNELGANHRHLAGRIDAEPDLTSFEPDDGHANVVADE